jgi:Fe-S cluster assembly scaffold protein SufB
MANEIMPKPDARHTHLVALEFKLTALSLQLKDRRAKWIAECAEDTKAIRDEIGVYRKRKAELMAEVAQQWLPMDFGV